MGGARIARTTPAHPNAPSSVVVCNKASCSAAPTTPTLAFKWSLMTQVHKSRGSHGTVSSQRVGGPPGDEYRRTDSSEAQPRIDMLSFRHTSGSSTAPPITSHFPIILHVILHLVIHRRPLLVSFSIVGAGGCACSRLVAPPRSEDGVHVEITADRLLSSELEWSLAAPPAAFVAAGRLPQSPLCGDPLQRGGGE